MRGSELSESGLGRWKLVVVVWGAAIKGLREMVARALPAVCSSVDLLLG